MNQELMTLDFWQDTVIYEGKTFPVGHATILQTTTWFIQTKPWIVQITT